MMVSAELCARTVQQAATLQLVGWLLAFRASQARIQTRVAPLNVMSAPKDPLRMSLALFPRTRASSAQTGVARAVQLVKANVCASAGSCGFRASVSLVPQGHSRPQITTVQDAHKAFGALLAVQTACPVGPERTQLIHPHPRALLAALVPTGLLRGLLM